MPHGELVKNYVPEISLASGFMEDSSKFIPVKHTFSLEHVDNEGAPGYVDYPINYSTDDALTFTTEGPGTKPFTSSLIESMSIMLKIQRKMRGTFAERAVAAKEAIQFAELVKSSRVYRRILEIQGATFTPSKTANVSDDTLSVNCAYTNELRATKRTY